MNNDYILEMTNINKSFSGVQVLKDMHLNVKKATVHGLMGENGAGKSTLMKILIGLYTRDTGEIIFDGQPLNTKSIHVVLNQGISMIHQELNELNNMTVAENVYCGKNPTVIKHIMVDEKATNRGAAELLEHLGIDINPKTMVSKLSSGQKQLLEIAKAVSYNAKLIIMDEPTSAITEKECEKLFGIINDLKKQGVSFIYISHKMNEIFEICDEVTVMRDGHFVATEPIENVTPEMLVKLMVGREITEVFPKEEVEIGDPALEVEHLSVEGLLNDVNFSVHKGEILGVSGLMGAGRTEIMETIFGLRKADSGTVKIHGETVSIKKPKKAIKNKIAFLTEERKKDGCFLPLDVYNNAMMLSWPVKNGVISHKKGKKMCKEWIETYNVKTTGPSQIMRNLSGGNQQKLLIARWLMTDPDIIILDEPTRGIDVGSKHEIYKEMVKLARAGKAIVMVSSEMPEVLGMSDRIMVIHDGTVAGILDAKDATQEKLLMYSAGLVKNTEGE